MPNGHTVSNLTQVENLTDDIFVLLKPLIQIRYSSHPNVYSQTSGVGTSGLQVLIQSNDTDIANIKSKTDNITVTQAVDLDQQANAISSLGATIQLDGNGDSRIKSASGNKTQFYNSTYQ